MSKKEFIKNEKNQKIKFFELIAISTIFLGIVLVSGCLEINSENELTDLNQTQLDTYELDQNELNQNETNDTIENTNETNNQEFLEKEIKIILYDSIENETIFETTNKFDKEKNGLEIMKIALNEKVEYEKYAFGVMITNLNDIEIESNEYWALYINGEYGTKGIEQYKAEEIEIIEWKIEQIQDYGNI